jgi:hypothetical protein
VLVSKRTIPIERSRLGFETGNELKAVTENARKKQADSDVAQGEVQQAR